MLQYLISFVHKFDFGTNNGRGHDGRGCGHGLKSGGGGGWWRK